jgi:hypothetical protein
MRSRWRLPVLRTPLRYSFELLSRRFNAAHLFNTEEETGGN